MRNVETISNDADQALLATVQEVIDGKQRPMLVGREGAHVPLPEPLFHLLTRAVRLLASGQSIAVLSENEELTTKAAANHLGMSRPHFLKLLEEGQIPFHWVGTHRRIYLKDLLTYQKRRDAERRKSLDSLTRKLEEAGLYDSDYTGRA